jgi:hypothetical protein
VAEVEVEVEVEVKGRWRWREMERIIKRLGEEREKEKEREKRRRRKSRSIAHGMEVWSRRESRVGEEEEWSVASRRAGERNIKKSLGNKRYQS